MRVRGRSLQCISIMSSVVRENTILIDWLSITSKLQSPEEVISLIGMQDCKWEITRGAFGYQSRYFYEHISIHFNGAPGMGVWLEMSGQGCRAFETYGSGDYNVLFDLVLNCDGINITRLDIAFDEYAGILDIGRVCDDTRKRRYRSKMDYFNVQYSSNGESIDIGSHKSDTMIRIYDKLAERLSKLKKNEDKEKIENEISHWIRIEVQFRDERAREFVRLLYEGTKEIGIAFSGVLRNYLEYGYYRTDEDSGKQRFVLFDYWDKLIGASEKLSVWKKPGTDYNLQNLENLVINQIGNANSAYLQIMGVEAFMKKLSERTVQPNPKYQRLVNEYVKQPEKPVKTEKVYNTLDELLNDKDNNS